MICKKQGSFLEVGRTEFECPLALKVTGNVLHITLTDSLIAQCDEGGDLYRWETLALT